MSLDELVNELSNEVSKILKKIDEEKKILNKLDFCTKCDIDKFRKNEFLEDKDKNLKWILWIDILGFKEIIISWNKDQIFQLLSFIKNFLNKSLLYKEVYMFSDTIIAITEFGDLDLIFVLENLAILQIQVLDTFKVFIRGALTLGDIFSFSETQAGSKFVSNNLYLFGNGLINAYFLEKRAKYPIIILDEKLSSIIELIYKLAESPRYQNLYPEQYKNGLLKKFFPHGDSNFSFLKDRLLKNMIAKTKDNLHFIDYLLQLYSVETEEDLIRDFLELHKSLIIKQFFKYRKNPRIKKKFSWLIQYHNFRVPEEFKIRIFKPHYR